MDKAYGSLSMSWGSQLDMVLKRAGKVDSALEIRWLASWMERKVWALEPLSVSPPCSTGERTVEPAVQKVERSFLGCGDLSFVRSRAMATEQALRSPLTRLPQRV